MARRAMKQLELEPKTWGGRRKGAGRPRTRTSPMHRARPEHKANEPVHVTLRVAPWMESLRRWYFPSVRAAIHAGSTRSFRVCHYSVQDTHVHLIVESTDKDLLWRGIRGLTIRIARAINRKLNTHGRVFLERYHARPLRTPTEVRNAIEYVLGNGKKHGVSGDADPCSSAMNIGLPRPRTWLLGEGRRRGRRKTSTAGERSAKSPP
jgi:hypothetical protein